MVKSLILWDWNGTLLDDVDVCVDSMNCLLSKRKLKSINKQIYRNLFGFPVKDYYTKLGFAFTSETFEEVSVEFISEYKKRAEAGAKLYGQVTDVLHYFRSLGKQQVIMSAMESQMLQKQLAFYGVHHLFDDVCGVSDIYANGKTELAKNYLLKNKINSSDVVFIGDTLHDAEVAGHIGCELILVSHGHHDEEKLKQTGKPILKDLNGLHQQIS